MIKKICIVLASVTPLLAFCYQQQYVSAANTNQTQQQAQSQKNIFSKPSNPMDIYLTPQQQRAEQQRINQLRKNEAAQYQHWQQQRSNAQMNSRSNQSQRNLYQPKLQNQWQQINKRPRAQTTNSMGQSMKQTYVPQSTQSNLSNRYTMGEQKAWLENCLASVKDKRAMTYAENFCSCGWRQIASGKLPPRLLTSTRPADIAQANRILKGISQTCLVAVQAQQGQEHGQKY